MVRIPEGLAAHLVPVLDLSSDWSATWQSLSELAVTHRLGGILLRRGRRVDWEQIAQEAHALADRKPLFLADFEQGAASQIMEYPWLPKAFTVGATRSPSLARRLGEAIARQARALGIEMVLAPVADLLFPGAHSIIGTRAFGATPHMVGGMVASFITGCQGEGVKAVAKHFPGHGRSRDDSHQRLGLIAVDWATWRATDAVPFRMAIDAGVAGVMVGHLWSEGLDPGNPRPASRSPVVLRRILRNELGFTGTVITDSLEMIGAGGAGLPCAMEAVAAGADLVIGPDLGLAKDVAAPLRQAHGGGSATAAEGELATEIAEKAVTWINRAQSRVGDARPSEVWVVPDRWGDSAWAAPLEAELQSRLAPGGEGRAVIAVSGMSDPAEAVQSIAALVTTRSWPMVVIACGAIDVALQVSNETAVILTGDATSASQRAAARLLCGEIAPTGNPDLPRA